MTPGRGPLAVAASDVSVRWQGAAGEVLALGGVDLEVASGEVVAIVGPSGCGKSTFLKVVAGLLAPQGGEVSVDGAPPSVGRCAWMPQRDHLLPWRRVVDNATLGAELAGRPRAEARAEATALLERFGLGGLERAWPAELSGGMRQRVAVLRTFLSPSPLLLLDEPLGALDALTRREMQSWLQEVWATTSGGAHDRTMLLVTHDVEEALLLADEVVVLSARPGRVVERLVVGHPRPRPPELVADPAFVAQRAQLLRALGT